MPSLEDARKNRDKHHKHPHGGLTPPPYHAGSSHAAPVHSSAPKNSHKPPAAAQIKRASSKTDNPAVTPVSAAPFVEPLPVRASSNPVAYRPSPRKPGSSSNPNSRHSFKLSFVHRGDSLWRIAKRELGSGHRWREIRIAHGGHLTERGAKRLQIGTPIYLPSFSTSSSQNHLSTPTSAGSSVSSYSKKPSSTLGTEPVTFVSASGGNLKTKPASSPSLAPASQRKLGVKPAPSISTTSKDLGTKRESGIQRYTPTAKKNFDSRSTALSSTARRNLGGQPTPLPSTTAGSSRTKRESGSQRNSQLPASWAGFPVLATQVAQSRVAQAHHVAMRVGVPISEAQSSAALAGGVRGAILLKPPITVNSVAEAFGSTQVRGAAKGAFKVLAPIGIAVDAVQLRSAWKKDHGFGPNVRKVAGSATGGWAGAAGGVELGAAIGSLVPGVGTVIGALVGGMAGAVTGSKFGEKVAERGEQSFQGERTQQTNNFSRANQYPHW